ncbi:MAG: alpha-mannosidase [Abditibacteriota bacterium]|nr:alpha-mannosidase [Abditibacteriota bacterium]
MPATVNLMQRANRQLLNTLHQKAYRVVGEPLGIEVYRSAEPLSFEERTRGERLVLRKGDSWGKLFDCGWFHFTGQVPAEAAGCDVVLLIDVSGEGCVVDRDGVPQMGITNKASDFDRSHGEPGKRVYPMFLPASGGETVDLWMDAGLNDLFGRVHDNGAILEADIAIRNNTLLALYYDVEVLEELSRVLPQNRARACYIRETLYEVATRMTEFTEEEALWARETLKPCLEAKGGDTALTLSAIGHSHLDLAWLWPVRETKRKGARTFATVLHYMDLYPDFQFVQSQAQLYDWIRKEHPALYAKVKARAAEKRWEPNGSMWVEPDCNMPSGESFVRQFLYGQRFFRDEFGKYCDVCFLPDTFGYSAALPQILRGVGVRYFTTQKMSWNSVNRFPYQSFVWQGLDGSRVLAHMLPEQNYLSSAMPRAIKMNEENYYEKGKSSHALMLFGIGDGGGGPGEEHLERIKRQLNMPEQIPIVQETTSDFFAKLAREEDRLPCWTGEMYLEYHQGTLTTQARNKKWNRRMELSLRDAELLGVMAETLAGTAYPAGELEEIWKETLLYQFHDILPGSSIGRVYDESRARYEIMDGRLADIKRERLRSIGSRIDTSGCKKPVAAVNTLSFDRSALVKRGGEWLRVSAPALGWRIQEARPADYAAPSASDSCLENELVRVELNPGGSLTIYDKEAGRYATGEAARLIVHEDSNDAWDMYHDYDRRKSYYPELTESAVYTDGPTAVCRQTYRFNESVITRTITVTAGSKRVDISARADWKENMKMLRSLTEISVHTDHARSEIQFGNIKRPNHLNTSWDTARFETCAHKWIDMSDRSYGVSIINDCKYGHRALGNTVSLNLLRATTYPDTAADRAVHTWSYALYPHRGDYAEGDVVREAYGFNVPLQVYDMDVHEGALPAEQSFAVTSSPAVLIDTVKKAEDGDGIVIRMYESCETSGAFTLKPGFGFKKAWLCDLLERPVEELEVTGGAVALTASPFKVISVLFK